MPDKLLMEDDVSFILMEDGASFILLEEFAFATTGILDSFTRADETPIAGGWSANPIFSGVATGRVVSNALATTVTSGGTGHPYWNTSFAADQEVYATVPSWTGVTDFYLVGRITSPNTAAPSYIDVRFASGGAVTIHQFDGATETTLGSTTITPANGDTYGLEIIGTAVTAYRKPSGGAWTFLVAGTTTIAGAGFIGLFLQTLASGTTIADDFGGGATRSVKQLLIFARQAAKRSSFY